MDKKLKGAVDKFILAGMGIASVTKDRTKKLVEELTSKGEISKKKTEKLMKEITKKGKEAKKELEKFVEKAVKKSLDKVGIATKKDLEELKKKIKK